MSLAPAPLSLFFDPQDMIAAYIQWREQNPDGNWDVQPSVQATVAINTAETFFKGLNHTPGQVNIASFNVEAQGSSLVGSSNNMSVVLDASDGTFILNGAKKDKLQSSGGILITSQVGPNLSTEVIVIILSVRPGIKIH